MLNLSFADVAGNLGNWSSDKSSYSLTSYINTLGNWSDENTTVRSLYYSNVSALQSSSNAYYDNISSNNQSIESMLNLSFADVAGNLGNWSSDRSEEHTSELQSH